jgi:hypothetical protein
MANDVQRDAGPTFQAENEVDLLLGGAHPNPTREGCPPREALIALTRRQVPVGDAVGEHVSQCSPCYREMRAIQQAEGIRPAEERRASRFWWPAAAAAVLVLAAGLVAWLVYGNRQPAPAPAPEQIVADAEPVEVTFDLRNYGVTRSDTPGEDLPPLVLPRAKVKLTLLLPVGSEAGEYEVRVVGGDGRVLASAGGRGETLGIVTRLAVSFELQLVSPGVHRLWVRRSGEGWYGVDVVIREVAAATGTGRPG